LNRAVCPLVRQERDIGEYARRQKTPGVLYGDAGNLREQAGYLNNGIFSYIIDSLAVSLYIWLKGLLLTGEAEDGKS
jgi:hypothetical protein